MNKYEDMYQKFNISEEDKSKFKTMSDSEYSKSNRVAMLSVKTTTNNNGNQSVEKKEVINAELV